MATSATHEKVHHAGVPVYPNDIEQKKCKEPKESDFDYFQRASLGANDGLVSIASHGKLEIGEFVAVYTQLDVETAQIKRENNNITNEKETAKAKEKLPSPFQESVASAFSFLVGGLVPLMAAAFITNYMVMVIAVVAVSSLQLVV
ncbi:unnamed protein product [Prunus armeniaca]|uniref:Uncharacterized protein n=1 Tax=Prunus armeniaca TaxID=36596 RepID=A0A6J5TUI2_PRUAR|nr:unnamed protein product [Prunus armeniaca]